MSLVTCSTDRYVTEKPLEVTSTRLLNLDRPRSPSTLLFLEMQRGQNLVLEQNLALMTKINQLSAELKAKDALLRRAHGYLIRSDICCIFQALNQYPGLAQAVVKKLEGKDKNPLSIIRAVEFIVNEDETSKVFAAECADPSEKILDGFVWVRADVRKDVLQALDNYNTTLRLLGETFTPQLAPTDTENLLMDLAKMTEDPAKVEEAKAKIKEIKDSASGSLLKTLLIALIENAPTILQTAAAIGVFGEIYVGYKIFAAIRTVASYLP